MTTTLDRHGTSRPRLWDCARPFAVAGGRLRTGTPYTFWVVLITVAAGILRLLYLDSQGITLDEGFSLFLGRCRFDTFLNIVWRSELNMGLYYLLLRVWMHLGHGEWIVRFLNVILSTITIPVLYALGSRLFDRRVGLVAALVLAVHPYHIMLAQRARSYPLVILLLSLSSLCLVRGLRTPTWTNWLSFAMLSAAAVYSHFFALLVIAAQLVSLGLHRQTAIPRKPLLFSLAVLAVLLLPFAYFMATNASMDHLSWIQNPSSTQMRYVLYSLTLSKGRSLVYLFLWCVGLYSWYDTLDPDKRWAYKFTFAWLALPIAMALGISVRHPLMIERYFSICIPASVLLAGTGIVRLWTCSRAVALCVLGLVVFYSAAAIRFYDRHPEFGEGWRESSRWILQRVQAQDVVIAESLAGFTFDYYRETYNGKLPPFKRLDSFTLRLPSPPAQNIWILGSVRFNPNWRGAVPGATESAVRHFAQAHEREYCPSPPNDGAGETGVWHFSRCAP